MLPDPKTEANAEAPPPAPSGQPPSKPKRQGCVTCGVFALVIILGVGRWSWIELQTVVAGANAISSVAGARIVLRQYAETDGRGFYPDGQHPEITSANALFRELFKAELVTNESCFTCRGSSSGLMMS